MNEDHRKLCESALEAMGGGVLVLDPSLRVVMATPMAQRLLGVRVAAGVHAVKLLCGDAVERPLAEALAAGKPVVATLPRFKIDGAERILRLRAAPLRALGRPHGWILRLSEETVAADATPERFHGMWTRDVTMKHVFRLAERVASSDACVLIEGEMGTGKSSLAEAIHAMSSRHAAPFRTLACASATPEILERQLEADSKHEGTLFLDDVGELRHDVQAELLRALESGVITPLDGGPPKLVAPRVIAAAHVPLHTQVAHGRFRADLFYRLGAVTLHLPPLRARRGDVALLLEKFVAEMNERGRRRIERVAPNASARLEQHSWPGNVRELLVAIEAAFATGQGPVLGADELPSEVEPLALRESVKVSAIPSPIPIEDMDEAMRIRRALEQASGDRVQAATMLGMSRTTLWRRMRALGLLTVLLTAGCGGTSRFALRGPVLRDADDKPLSHAPVKDEESDYANTIDMTLMRPLSRAFLAETSGESRNVNSLDEVPDSTWFTNRMVTSAEVERGPCPDGGPVLPLTVKSSLVGGTTPGFVVKDARGQKYVAKMDGLARYEQPEISTAADAIVSRLYWASGFNAPCNQVIYVESKDLRLAPDSVEIRDTGRRYPLTLDLLTSTLASATRDSSGAFRLSASRFIDGEGVGTWRTEGTRADDPNDVIPHEDRRELRGERFLAAWVDHWDSRGLNSYDAYVAARGAPPGAGYVVHYFLDFSDSLGGTSGRTRQREPRLGFSTVSNLPVIMADSITFGLIRRPWDEVHVDPVYADLGTMNDVAAFDPYGFAPQTPLVRWARAQPSDLGWMARRIARLGLEDVRAAVRAGRLSRPIEEARLVEVLMARREKILRAAFAKSSPLAELSMAGPDRLCGVDLAIATGISPPARVAYSTEVREGPTLARAPQPALVEPQPGGRLCVVLPAHFAAAAAADDSTDRYATLDVVRLEQGGAKTRLRAHFYDLGTLRGWVLVGLERL